MHFHQRNKGKVGAGFSFRLLLQALLEPMLSLPKSAEKANPEGSWSPHKLGNWPSLGKSSYSQPGCSKSPFFWCAILKNDSLGFTLINNGDLWAGSKSQHPSADPALGKGGAGCSGWFLVPRKADQTSPAL